MSLPLAFLASPRSFTNYWLCWVALAALSPRAAEGPVVRWRTGRTALALYLAALASIGVAAAAYASSPLLKVEGVEALDLNGDGYVDHLRVEVSSRVEVEPRLAVTLDNRAYYWGLVEGPSTLKEERVTYLFEAPSHLVELPRGSCFTVFLNDAHDYRLFTVSGPHPA